MLEIKKVACVGAGLIGQGWAALFSSRRLQVSLHDVDEAILGKAMKRVEENLIFLEEKGLLGKGEAKEAHRRINPTTSLADALLQVDYVQESVPDRYEVKMKVFAEMDALAPGHVILASSSSGLLMTEIQKATEKPERCVMAHPMLPPHIIPVVEIVGGERTSAETVERTRDFMASLGRVPVVLNREVPGYIVNRLQAALWREAVSLVANGVASAEDVDRAFCLGMGLRDPLFGPCLRAHVAGKGIERFIEGYAQSYSSRWKTMETWTSIPSTAARMVVESVNQMSIVKAKTMDEIEGLRDEKLVEILRVVQPRHPFY